MASRSIACGISENTTLTMRSAAARLCASEQPTAGRGRAGARRISGSTEVHCQGGDFPNSKQRAACNCKRSAGGFAFFYYDIRRMLCHCVIVLISFIFGLFGLVF